MADNRFDLIDEPIAVHAGRDTLQSLREHIFNWKIWPDFSVLPDESQPLLRWSELAMEEKIDLGGERTITPFRVLHTVPANGYAIEGRSGTLAFTGDTYADDALWHFLNRSEEHTSELQSLMRISYAVFCLKKKKSHLHDHTTYRNTHIALRL